MLFLITELYPYKYLSRGLEMSNRGLTSIYLPEVQNAFNVSKNSIHDIPATSFEIFEFIDETTLSILLRFVDNKG